MRGVSLCVVLVLLAGVTWGDEAMPGLSVSVQADAVQPAGQPVLLTLTVTNITRETIRYMCGAPGGYPNAGIFIARVTDAQGKTRMLGLANGGAFMMLPGWSREIKPGESLVIPACLASGMQSISPVEGRTYVTLSHGTPLQPGTYTIQVRDSKPVRVSIKDDAALTRAREQIVLAGVRTCNHFFMEYFAIEHRSKAVVDALLRDITGDDVSVARWAVCTLLRLRPLPEGAVPFITTAMRKHLTSVGDPYMRSALLVDLAAISGVIGTDEAMVPVLALAHADVGDEHLRQSRGQAVSVLGRFKQARATQELRGFLNDRNAYVQLEAARALARRKHPAAIDTLLAIAGDRKNQWREYAMRALVNYPNDPRVEPALRVGLTDPDASTQRAARKTLDELQKVRKP